MFKAIDNLKSSLPKPLIYTCKVVWFTLLILAIFYFAKRDGSNFGYWDGDRNPKANKNITVDNKIFH
jgi:hypothetical protein